MNRDDLNLARPMKLGEWDKVPDIISKNNANTKHENLKIAYNNYADELMKKKIMIKLKKIMKNPENTGINKCIFCQRRL